MAKKQTVNVQAQKSSTDKSNEKDKTFFNKLLEKAKKVSGKRFGNG